MRPTSSEPSPQSTAIMTDPVTEPIVPQPASRLPLRAFAALAVMVAIVGGVGYLMYDRIFGGTSASSDLVDIIPTRGGRGAAPGFGQPRVQPDGVRELGRNNYQVKAGEARLNVRQARGGEWTFNFTYQKPDLLTPEQDNALLARWRLPRDDAFAKSLDVTPEQIKQLDAIPGREGMIVTDTDRQQVKRLFDAYLSAAPPRSAETAALVEALREIGDRSLAPTRATLAERASQVQSVLTPEQLAKFQRPRN